MKKLNPRQIKILSNTFVFLSLLWVSCFILGPISTFGLIQSEHLQYPPGDIMKVITDNDGNSYYSDAFYGRVQTFDKYGRFKNNWLIDASGGSFDIDIINNNRIKVITARTEKEYIYDLTGHLISKANNKNFQRKKASNSHSLKSLQIPFYLWIFSPFISIAYAIIGVIGGRLIKKYEKKLIQT